MDGKMHYMKTYAFIESNYSKGVKILESYINGLLDRIAFVTVDLERGNVLKLMVSMFVIRSISNIYAVPHITAYRALKGILHQNS